MAESAVIMTHTGKFVDLLRPEAALVDIEDIAHALSRINRFTGHTSEGYTVAEHCLHASHLGLGDPLVCLLHDSAEAYLGDVASPLKRQTLIDIGAGPIPFKELEALHLVSIGEALGCPALPYMTPDEKQVDLVLLVAEARAFLGADLDMPAWRPWFSKAFEHREHVYKAWDALWRWQDRNLSQDDIKRLYLERYEELKNG